MLFSVVKNAFKLSNSPHKRRKISLDCPEYKPTLEKHIQLSKYCVPKLFIPQT